MITYEHIRALSHINRYNGWTIRPYSVLEHTVIGTEALIFYGDLDAARMFLIHDLHESVTGDPTWTTKQFYDLNKLMAAQMEFDHDLQELVGAKSIAHNSRRLAKQMDIAIAQVEIENLCPKITPEWNLVGKDFGDHDFRAIADKIENCTHMGHQAIWGFRNCWARLSMPNLFDYRLSAVA